MPTPVRTTISAVARRYRDRKLAEELVDDWFFLVYRLFSFVLVPPLARAGVAPSAVTLAASAVAVALPAVAWVWGWGALATAMFLFCVMDGVDGDLARTYGQGTAAGAWLDANVDLLYRVTSYAAVGIACAQLAQMAQSASAPAWMLLAAAMALLARLSRATARLQRPPGTSDQTIQTPSTAATRGVAGWAYGFISSLDHALPLLVALAGTIGALEWLVAWLVLYSVCDYLVALRESWLSQVAR